MAGWDVLLRLLYLLCLQYKTPAGDDIDHVGIRPDSACALPGASADGAAFMPGIPVDATTRDALMAQLQADTCMAAAESLLAQELTLQAQGPPPPGPVNPLA